MHRLEYNYVTCEVCGEKYLARRGEYPLVSHLAHARAAKKKHDKILLQMLNDANWESVLERKVIPFQRR